MKKIIIFTLFFTLFGCVAGDFPENRERLYRMGHDSTVCRNHPEKCVDACRTNPEICTNETVW